MERDEINAALRRLGHSFPDVPHDVVTSVFADSYQRIVDVSELPLVGSAERLARIRLEARTRHPAVGYVETG